MIITHKRKHHQDFSSQLAKAKLVADYAVANKGNIKLLSSKHVKEIGLKSAISCQILMKYGRNKTIKNAKNVNLVISGSKEQNIKYYPEKSEIYIKPMKYRFSMHFGKPIIKVNQIEIDSEFIYVTITVTKPEDVVIDDTDVLGVDLNCGVGRHVAVAACLSTGKTMCLNRQGPNIRKKYFKKRQAAQRAGDYKTLAAIGHKESRIQKDMDHKMSRKIVDYALEHKCRVVVEDLKGLRNKMKKGENSRGGNRVVNSWSYFRLQTFIEYKCQAAGLAFVKVPPHYTSQYCSYCGKPGYRYHEWFKCFSKKCDHYGERRNSDVNAAWNIGLRYWGVI